MTKNSHFIYQKEIITNWDYVDDEKIEQFLKCKFDEVMDELLQYIEAENKNKIEGEDTTKLDLFTLQDKKKSIITHMKFLIRWLSS